MSVQIDGEDISVVFSGALWNWRERFDNEGISSFRDENDRPFRVIPKINDDSRKIADMIPRLFSNAVMRVVVDGACKPGSKADALVCKLRENPQLFFV